VRRKLLSGCSNLDVFFLVLVAVGVLGGCIVTVVGAALIMAQYF
jgi:hypothetical protein